MAGAATGLAGDAAGPDTLWARVPPVALLEAEFEALDPVEIPLHSGSVWRGAFGFALKRTVCAMRLRPCEGCPLEYGCIHTSLFETRPPPGGGAMTRYDRAPHPFFLRMGAEAAVLSPGGRFRLGFGLAGRAADWAVYAVRAFGDAAAAGIGRGRGRMRLAALRDGAGRSLLDTEGRVLPPARMRFEAGAAPAQAFVRFVSPLRVLREGRLVGPEMLGPRDLAATTLRRASMLARFFGEAALEADFAGMLARAASVPVMSRDLAWRDDHRPKSRQKQALRMGGVVGTLALDISAAPDLWPVLRIADHLGAGKGVTMGLGHVEVTAA